MQLRKIFEQLAHITETTAEDRELIRISQAVLSALQESSTATTTRPLTLGTLHDIFPTLSIDLKDVTIQLDRGEEFMARAMEGHEYSTAVEILAFWDEPTSTIVVNEDYLTTPRMVTTITHELRHALDATKSCSYPGGAASYFTPRKKEHRITDPYSTVQYRAQPAEINARFTEVLHMLSKRVARAYKSLDPVDIKPQLTKDFQNLMVKYEIADLFPERTASSDYKRLVKRAYQFIQHEMDRVEADPTNQKRATGGW